MPMRRISCQRMLKFENCLNFHWKSLRYKKKTIYFLKNEPSESKTYADNSNYLTNIPTKLQTNRMFFKHIARHIHKQIYRQIHRHQKIFVCTENLHLTFRHWKNINFMDVSFCIICKYTIICSLWDQCYKSSFKLFFH